MNSHAYARATNIMSTQSETNFEWSIKLIGTGSFRVGITSQLQQRDGKSIVDYDRNAILYSSSGRIRIGSNQIHSNLPEQKDGDIVHFKFESQTRKLVMVRIRKFAPTPINLRTNIMKWICKTVSITSRLFSLPALMPPKLI